jgi:hypothetical protein
VSTSLIQAARTLTMSTDRLSFFLGQPAAIIGSSAIQIRTKSTIAAIFM